MKRNLASTVTEPLIGCGQGYGAAEMGANNSPKNNDDQGCTPPKKEPSNVATMLGKSSADENLSIFLSPGRDDENTNMDKGQDKLGTDDNEGEVDRITGIKFDQEGNATYQVKWKDCIESTWEPAEELSGCEQRVKDFEKQFRTYSRERYLEDVDDESEDESEEDEEWEEEDEEWEEEAEEQEDEEESEEDRDEDEDSDELLPNNKKSRKTLGSFTPKSLSSNSGAHPPPPSPDISKLSDEDN